ncbi:gluconokinase [Deefgea salmonis]|uniref:Gluconokinase n=1 Tax=Deefgea salmonis TaxID=2875502 RepID=A0ABS8BMZ2_9NEIS|nr:gluconokinase [Deefgea salmonis]MCB5197081.1 gluconokinase [Deefgea salmonis]
MTSTKVYVLMGVSGCGKTAVANQLAKDLNAAFLDGDFLHPRANIEKMASGQPLNDDDRAPWLGAINDAAFAMQRTNPVSLIVCSALKKSYRDRLRQGNPNLSFVFLKGDYELIEQRLIARQGHFQKSGMLASQFATLEVPSTDESDVIVIDIAPPLESVIAAAHQAILAQE